MILTKEQVKEIFGVDYYDGCQIHNRFAYTVFRDKVLPIGNIIAFRSPTKVLADQMIDKEDLLSNDFIFSQDMINFCFELPMTNLFGGVCFQRLLCSLTGNILSEIIKADVDIDGDDIFVKKEFTGGGIVQQRGKASVSIVCERNGAILGHIGVNVVAGREAPAFAYSTNMSHQQCEQFMVNVIQAYYAIAQDVFVATSKIV